MAFHRGLVGKTIQLWLLTGILVIAPISAAVGDERLDKVARYDPILPGPCTWTVIEGRKLIRCGALPRSENAISRTFAQGTPPKKPFLSDRSQASPLQANESADGFLVVVDDQKATIAKLNLLHVKDFVVLGYPYQNRISLGYFKGLKNARERQTALLLLGVESEIIDRSAGEHREVSVNNLKAMSLALGLQYDPEPEITDLPNLW